MLGFRGLVGFAEESASAAYATAVAAAKYVPFLSENFTSDENFVIPDSIVDAPYVLVGAPGRHVVKPAQIDLHPDSDTIGWAAKWANRNMADTAWPPAPTIPSATAATGGSLAAGTYKYYVAHVYQLTGTSNYWLGNLSAEFSGTTASGNLTLTLAWTNATAPSGYSIFGTAIFRTASGGLTGTEKFTHFVSGSASTYSDAGDVNGTVAPPASTITKHTNNQSNNDQKTFTVEVGMDGWSKQIAGCKIGDLSIDVPSNGPVKFQMGGIVGQQLSQIASTSPTYAQAALLSPLLGHNSIVYYESYGTADTYVPRAASFSGKFNNNLEPIESIDGSRFIRALRNGPRTGNGSLTMQLDDDTQFNQVLADTEMGARIVSYAGVGLDGGAFSLTMGGQTVKAWPGMLEVVTPNFYITSNDAKLPNKKQLIITLPFSRLIYDPTTSSDWQINVVNTTSTYANVP
ncbi:MAG: phage tail tube protein [Candidatus Xenobia bacterium]